MVTDLVREFIEKKQLCLKSLRILGILACLMPVIVSYVVTSISTDYPIVLDQISSLKLVLAGAFVLLFLYFAYRFSISKFLLQRAFNSKFNQETFKNTLKNFFPNINLAEVSEDEIRTAYAVEKYVSSVLHFIALNMAVVTGVGIAVSLYTSPILSIVFAFYGILLSIWASQKMLPRIEKL